jgi:hypothetical protein
MRCKLKQSASSYTQALSRYCPQATRSKNFAHKTTECKMFTSNSLQHVRGKDASFAQTKEDNQTYFTDFVHMFLFFMFHSISTLQT